MSMETRRRSVQRVVSGGRSGCHRRRVGSRGSAPTGDAARQRNREAPRNGDVETNEAHEQDRMAHVVAGSAIIPTVPEAVNRAPGAVASRRRAQAPLASSARREHAVRISQLLARFA
jgi:hypothetical protein